MFEFMFASSFVQDFAFTEVKMFLPFGFQLFQGIKILLLLVAIIKVVDREVDSSVISKGTDLGSYMIWYVVYVEKE